MQFLKQLRKKLQWSLAREITCVVIIKMLLLYGVWSLWFNHPIPKNERANATAQIILSTPKQP
jgi:hypothetical protein